MVFADNGKNLFADNVWKQRRFCRCQPFCFLSVFTFYRHYCYQLNCNSVMFRYLKSFSIPPLMNA